MITFAFFVYAILYFSLSYKYFRRGLQFFVLILPTYLLRADILKLPTTLLEISFGVLFLVWLIRYAKNDFAEIRQFICRNKALAVFLFLFLASSFVSIFVSDMWVASLGQWRAYFLEPVILFFIIIGRRKFFSAEDLILPLILSTLSVAVFGIVQKFTGWGLPTEEWLNPATRRITSFFTSPNAVGLYLVPPLMLVFYRLKNTTSKYAPYWYSAILIINLVAIYFTKSLGTIAAFIAGTLLYLFLIGRKQLPVILIALTVFTLILPPIRAFMVSKDRSSLNRITLWSYTGEFLTASPKNFVFGTGIRQFFRKIQKPHYDTKVLERLIYPHNIFLNFWTEIGLPGLIGFLGVCYFLFRSMRKTLRQNKYLGAALIASLAVILIHGQIDVPYFKNDLAMMFWIISGLIFTVEKSV